MAVTAETGATGVFGTASDVREASTSAVAWPAIIGGAFASAAVSVLLLALGSGIGFASVSPWMSSTPSATTFTAMAAIWLIIVQWVSSGLGGYLTGRLRTKWVEIHTQEVFFRDTANGFLTWAVASVFVVGLVASSASSIVGGTTRAATTVVGGALGGAAQGAMQNATPSGQADYFVDTLFRPAQPNANAPVSEVRGEAARILAASLAGSAVPPADRTYLAQLVAARAGIPQADAEKRIDDVVAKMRAVEDKARQAADVARKAAASLAFFTFFSMLIGAFIACVAAAIGGRQRDAI
jgi:hypothetical protein